MQNGSHNAFETAQKQFDNAAGILGLDQATRDLLRTPMREYHFSIPVRMDDGSVQIFRGFRVSTTMRAVRARGASASIHSRPSTRCARWRCG